MGLKIDICTHEAPLNSSGGPFVWAQRMPLEFIKLGHDVSVKLFNWNHIGNGKLSGFFKKNDIAFSERQILYTQDSVEWLLKLYKKEKPDIVIISLGVHSYYTTKWLKKAGIPVIGVIRSDDDYYHKIIDHFVFGKNKYRVSAMVSVSRYLTESIVSRKPNNVRTYTIPSGTVIPDYLPKKDNKTFRIIYVGRIVQEQKRIIELTQGFVKVSQMYNQIEALIVGGGPQEKEINRLITKNNKHNVRFLGHKENTEVIKLLQSSHAIVLMSDYEGNPTALMEAMACGCVPVCVNMKSGIPELIIHNKTGLLIHNRDTDFYNEVNNLMKDMKLLDRLSLNAKSHIKKYFSIHLSAIKWQKVFNDLKADCKQKSIIIPKNIVLPKTINGFNERDKRKPGFNFTQLKLTLGRFKHKLYSKINNK